MTADRYGHLFPSTDDGAETRRGGAGAGPALGLIPPNENGAGRVPDAVILMVVVRSTAVTGAA
jgi:hypothetical protein